MRCLVANAVLVSCVLLAAGALSGQEDGPPSPRRKVVTTLPVLADLARRVGGDDVEVVALARGNEDPHYVVPTPALMREVARADLFVELGMSLEVWAENVLDGARNPRVRRGAPGHVFAAAGIRPLGVPAVVTRARGDIHPEGNPHLWLDPLEAEILAANIEKGLERIAPERSERFAERLQAFRRELRERLFGSELVDLLGGDVLVRLERSGKLQGFLDRQFRGRPLRDRLGGWLAKAAPLRGREFVFYHDVWPYFARRFGPKVVGLIEERPGIPPSAAHKRALEKLMRDRGVRVIGILSYYDDSVARSLADAVGARVVVLPGDVGGLPGVNDYYALIDTLIARLVEAVEKG